MDGAGNVYVAGDVYNSANFGDGPMGASETDMFVVKLDAAGVLQWATV